jgi:hypothetical protein
MSGRRARRNVAEVKAQIDKEMEAEEREDDQVARIQEMKMSSVKWSTDKTHFNVTIGDKTGDSEGARFYGWFRKTRVADGEIVFAFDVFAKYKSDDVAVDCISYTTDPRNNVASLNADICAAINKWLYGKINGNYKTIDTLTSQAKQPTIRIHRIGTIDKIIMKLKECRDVAIRCGGHRLVQIHGDKDGEVPLNVIIDVTSQALALKGKVPSLELGSMMDRVIETGNNDKKSTTSKATFNRNIPEESNVQLLVERLKSTENKSEARKIRAVLRKMGHKGGARKA